VIRSVVFDFGQVLSSPTELYTAPAARLGVDAAAFEAAYWTDRVAYDRGGTDAAYWTPLLQSLGRRATPELVRELAALDARLWVEGVRPEALQVVKDVRAAGRLVAILSNAPFSLDLAFVDAPYADAADYWFVSASMGVTKPDQPVFYRVEEVLELPPDEIAFIDDRPANVHAAREAGWQAHLFVDDADMRGWLTDLRVLPA
jgi:putative hydrolase of the HAD superfamily